MAEIRINAGYVITDSIRVGNYEFVIGQNLEKPSRFVTWLCKNGNDYYCGNYMTSREEAEKDLLMRANTEYRQQNTLNTEKRKECTHRGIRKKSCHRNRR